MDRVITITSQEEATNALSNSIIGLIKVKTSNEFIEKAEEYRVIREIAKEKYGIDVTLRNRLVSRINEI